MPTPVSSARQCLTEKTAAALDDAVSVARRRGHSQTTSLHLVSSLLSLPNSTLREACTRIRNNAYSARMQFKALELSLSVALDRMPSSSKIEEPPVANSLMAAIKRSQANQRRQPENFSFYQQQQQYSSASVPIVRVELRNLILSILDDPVVSRVFGEAGFRSCDLKLATCRPGSSFYPFGGGGGGGCTSRYKRPMFLCNIGGEEGSGNGSGGSTSSKGFSFPFVTCGEENWRRIGEVMVRGVRRKRNPLLMGVSAEETLRSFLQTMERRVEDVLPAGLSGLSVVGVGDEVLRFVNGECDERVMEGKFEEVERLLESERVLVSIGDLKAFGGDFGGGGLRYLVGRFSKLLEVHGGKVWLIGAAVSYDVYFKFLNKFPSVEEDWDMEVLPITSLKFSVGGSYPRSSLMESFVPLGGFFSMPSDTKTALSNTGLRVGRCNLCNEKYQQEVAALSNGSCASITEQCQSSLPPWMQNSEPSTQADNFKAKNDSLLLNVKIAGVQKKWDNICDQYHHKQPLPEGNTHHIGYQVPRVFGFQVAAEKNSSPSNENRNQFNGSPAEQGKLNIISSLSSDLQQSSSTKELSSMSMQKATDPNASSKSGEIPPECHGGLKSRSLDSTTSVTSVTTDLGLGTVSAFACKEQEKLANQFRLDLSSSFSSNANSYRCSDVKDPKTLYKALTERVSWQEEAIIDVTKAITQPQTHLLGLNRSDLWINLHGPDILGKKKLAVALAEILYGSTESLVCIDLCFPNAAARADKLFGPSVTNRYDPSMRGTVIDYMVEKLSKKPSVVFIENVDKADSVVQNSLSHAVKTGRLMDLRGREVNVGNSIFLATTRLGVEELGKYSEEDLLCKKAQLIQVLIRFDLNDDLASHETGHLDKGFCDVNLMNKRKLIGGSRSTDQCGSSLELRKKAHKASNSYLDLNFPAEGSDISDPCASESDSGSSSENYRSWLENFDLEIGQRVVFRPFDFESLAERLSKEISECLHKVVGSGCTLEIEPGVMQQLLAAAYLSENKQVEDWIRHVLRQGFVEAMEKFSLDARSVVKLVTAKGGCSDEQPETLLPGRIIVN